MASKKQSYIGLEIDRYSKKVKEFQDYLEAHTLSNLVDPKTRVQEISLQITMMEKLGAMLQNLDNLREKKFKEADLRKGAGKNALMEEDEDEDL